MPGLNCEGSLRPPTRSKLWPPVVAVDVGRLRMGANIAATGDSERNGAPEAVAVAVPAVGGGDAGSASEDRGSIAALCLRRFCIRRKTRRRSRSMLKPATAPTTLPATAPGEMASLLIGEPVTAPPVEEGVAEAELTEATLAEAAVPVAMIPATIPDVVTAPVSVTDMDCEVLEVLERRAMEDDVALGIAEDDIVPDTSADVTATSMDSVLDVVPTAASVDVALDVVTTAGYR